MRQSERVRGGAEEAGEQSRRGSWSDTASISHSFLRTPDEACRIPIRSNRPKIQSCNTQNLSRKLLVSSPTRSSSRRPLPSFSNRELLGLEILQLDENKQRRWVPIAKVEPNDFLNFKVCLATLRACIATVRFRGAGLRPRKFNRALAPEADSFQFSRRPSGRTGLSPPAAELVEELTQQESGPK